MSNIVARKVPMFRPQAVNRHVDTDLEGGLLRSAPRWTLLLWAALTIVLLGALVAAAVVRVQVHTEGRGIIRPEGGALVVRAPRAGRVREVRAQDGLSARSGDSLVVLEDLEAGGDTTNAAVTVNVLATRAGVVDDVLADVGAHVQAGDPLCSLIPDDARLVGYVAIPERDRNALAAGQTMRLRIDAYPYQEHGIGEGKIVRTSPDLVSGKWARQLHAAGIDPTGMVLAEVELAKPPPKVASNGAANSGFRAGMLFTGEVVVREQRVASLLFRPLAGVLGD